MDKMDFSKFLQGLRLGHGEAVEKLDRRYGTYLRQLIRPWLAETGIQRISDSTDVCQSVLFKFLACMKEGRYPELDSNDQLERILCRMAKNAVRDLWRREKHTVRSQKSRPPENDLAAIGSTPSQHAARVELEKLFLSRLSDQARQIQVWRSEGWEWARIGAALNLPPNTVRIRFNRERARVARDLGLKETR